MKHTFPVNYGEECVIVVIDKSLVPLVAGALRPFEQPYSWVSTEDYEHGYNAFAELQADMANNYALQLLESNRQLYRLLDTALNGTQYTATGTPAVITPSIPAVPPAAPTTPAAALAQLRRLHQLAENAATGAEYAAGAAVDGTVALDYAGSWRARLEAVQGVINAGWFGIGGHPATLADLVSALRIGSDGDTTRITDAISAIAGDSALAQGSQAANIFGTVSDLFSDVAEVGAEGAVLGTLIAASIATSGMLGVLAGKLDQLVTAMNAQNANTDSVEPLLTDIKAALQ